MICKNCGINYPDVVARCPKCGAALPRIVKIFQPEPVKSSNAIRTIILLTLFFAAAGTALYKMYFAPAPDMETGQNAAQQHLAANAERGDAAAISESNKEKLSSASKIYTVSPDMRIESVVNKNQTGYAKKETRQNTGESLEDRIEKGFQKKEGSHFTVKFEGGENSDIGHLISIIMEEAYVKVGSDMGYYPDDRIEAVLYSQQQFSDVTRAPSWAGALYDGKIKIPVGGITGRTVLLERVLFHEYAHALVHRLSKGRAPVWLNEGIAQHVEGAINENINKVMSFIAKSEKPIPLRAFEGSFMGLSDVQAMVAYSVSLSATEYIINEFGMSAVKRILENLGEGKTLEQAISSGIYISYEDLQKNWFGAVKRRYAG